MKMKKIVGIGVAAMLTLSAANVFAAEIASNYIEAEGKVEMTANIPSGQSVYTVLVLKTAEDGSALTTVTDDDIIQIDEVSTLGDNKIVVGDLDAGTYQIRIGGTGEDPDEDGYAYAYGFFTVSDGGKYDDPDMLLGDIDNDGVFMVSDASAIIYHYVNKNLTGDQLQAADVDDDGSVMVNDASAVLYHYVNPELNTLGTKTLADRTTDVTE